MLQTDTAPRPDNSADVSMLFPDRRGRQLRDQFGLLTPEDLAALRDVDERTLAVERSQGRGPDYVKLGRKVFYRAEDVLTWVRLNVTQTDRAA